MTPPADFDTVVCEILEAADAGRPASLSWWARRYPQFRAELATFFTAQTAVTRQFPPALSPPPAARPTLPGFALHAEIGRGGVGVVYRATQVEPGRAVAVKVLAAGPLARPDDRERFRREAAAAARLDHPNVVPVFQVGEAGGLPYFVMPYYPGGSLADRPDEFRHDPRSAAELVRGVAAGVAHAHRHGILHRDLKPANVLLDAQGRPAVCDFGLMAADWVGPALTLSRELVGTPQFMAPEQADPALGPVTVATDVYGLGGVLYALLTGRPPHPGATVAQVLHQVRTADTPAPRSLARQLPADLDAVCRRCLARRPADRYPSADALTDDLGRFLAGRPVTARRPGLRRAVTAWGRQHPALLAAWAMVAAGVWGWGESVRRTAAERVAAADRAAVVAADFFADLERVQRRRLEQPAGWSAANRRAVARLAALPPAADHLPVLRTELVATTAAPDLGDPRELAVGLFGHSLAFAPDGRTLAVGAWQADAAGRMEVRLLDPAGVVPSRSLWVPADADWAKRDGRGLTDGVRAVAFSPDGRWLVAGGRSGRVAAWELTDPRPEPAATWRHAEPAANTRHDRIDRLEFTPGGRLLVATNGEVAVGREATPGWPERFRRAWPAGVLSRRASPTDPVRLLTAPAAEVVEAPPWLVPVAGEPRGGVTWAVGPGGRFELEARPGELWGRRPTPDGPSNLRLDEPGLVTDVALTPDGQLAAVAVEHAGRVQLWELAGGRSLAVRRLPGASLRLAFAPDGRSLAVVADRRVLLYPLVGGELCRPVGAGAALADAVPAGGGRLLALALGDRKEHLAELTLWAGGPTPAWATPVPLVVGNNDDLVAADPAGRAAVAAGNWAVWVAADGRSGDPIPGPTFHSLRELAVGPGGRLWAAADNALFRAEPPPAGGGWAATPAQPGRHYMSLTAVPAGVYAGRDDGSVSRHDPATGDRATDWPLLTTGVTAVAVTSDAGLAGGDDGTVAVFDPLGGAVRWRLPTAHADRVTAAAVGPGWLATGGRDRVVRLWTPAGELLLELPQTQSVRRLWAAGDTLTVLADGERAVRVWDLAALRASLEASGLPAGF